LTSIAKSFSGVDHLVEVTANLRNIPINQFDKEPGDDGNTYYRANFFIEMTYSSAKISFALRYKGVRYTEVTVDV
jgi:hypothetical protein